MRQPTVLVEGALVSAIFVILLMISGFVPLISIIAVYFLPLPIIYYTVRRGIKPGLTASAVAFAVSVVIAGLILSTLAVYGIISGLVIGYMLRHKRSSIQILIATSLANIITVVIYYGLSILLFNMDIIRESTQMLKNTLEKMKTFYEDQMPASADRIDAMIAQIEFLENLALLWLVLIGVIMAVITLLVNKPALRKLRVDFPEWLPFREWKFPKSIIFYFLAALIIFIFVRPETGTTLHLITANVLYLLFIILAVQGLSFIFYFSKAKELPRFVPVIAVILTLISSVILYIIVLLGIIELGYDLRKRIKK